MRTTTPILLKFTILVILTSFCSSYTLGQTKIFAYTGATETWTVPAGVNAVTMEVCGADGGNRIGGTEFFGGSASCVTSTFDVCPGMILEVAVGQAGGPNAGGAGSGVMNMTTNDLLIIAGGGGGLTSLSFDDGTFLDAYGGAGDTIGLATAGRNGDDGSVPFIFNQVSTPGSKGGLGFTSGMIENSTTTNFGSGAGGAAGIATSIMEVNGTIIAGGGGGGYVGGGGISGISSINFPVSPLSGDRGAGDQGIGGAGTTINADGTRILGGPGTKISSGAKRMFFHNNIKAFFIRGGGGGSSYIHPSGINKTLIRGTSSSSNGSNGSIEFNYNIDLTTSVSGCFDISDFSLADPCNCGNPNNRRATDGSLLLYDELKILGTTPGITHTLTANDGNFLDASGIPIAINVTTFVEDPLNPGDYALPFYTKENMPAIVSVSNGITTKEFTTDSCSCVAIPTMGEWGLMCLSLILLILGVTSIKTRALILSEIRY